MRSSSSSSSYFNISTILIIIIALSSSFSSVFTAEAKKSNIRGNNPERLSSDDTDDEIGKSFSRGDRVAIAANKIGPYNNPTETYSYYTLPYCEPEDVKIHDHQLGEVLSGDRKKSTDYEIRFLQDNDFKELCRVKLNQKQIETFYNAVDRDYYFELFIDGLPLWGYIGEYDTEKIYEGCVCSVV